MAVTITGGTVIARAGDGATRAIGRNSGSLSLTLKGMKAVETAPGTAASVSAAQLAEACSGKYVKLVPCKAHSLENGVCQYCGAVPALPYSDSHGGELTCENGRMLTEMSNTWNTGWLILADNLTFNSRIEVSGTVNLILCDGKTLTADKGIHVPPGAELIIWQQSAGTGKLTASAPDNDQAGIGGNKKESCGTVTVNGGTVTAAGGRDAAGIGGGSGGTGGTVTVNGGAVSATGNRNGAGIGGGGSKPGGTVTVNGGAVSATGGRSGAGIGGGNHGEGGTVTVSAGTVTATAGIDAEAIGHGDNKNRSGTLTLGDVRVYIPSAEGEFTLVSKARQTDACRKSCVRIMQCREHTPLYGICQNCGELVEAVPFPYAGPDGAEHSADVWTPVYSDSTTWTDGWYAVFTDISIPDRVQVTGSVNLILCDGRTLHVSQGIHVPAGASLTVWPQNGGTGSLVTGQPEKYQAGIGGNRNEACGAVTVNGGNISALGGENAAGIGGGGKGEGGTITINGGNVTATGGKAGSGIGGGNIGNGDAITINGGNITATGGFTGSGIGGGGNGEGGTITISGGTVSARGEDYGSGIGGGYKGAGGTITISGGTVSASGNEHGAGIGGGFAGSGGTITISGGTVSASGNEHGAGIGGGFAGSGGTIHISGGTITASSSNYGAGIGGGGGYTSEAGSGGTISITGGQITASSQYGYGIGPGRCRDNSTLIGDPGPLSLSWSQASHFISASSILASEYTIEKPFAYFRNGAYAGDVTAENLPAKESGDVLMPGTKEDACVSILFDGESLLPGGQLTLLAEAANPGQYGAWVWSSDQPETAAVDENGIVTALREGTARITAAYASATAQGSATVTLTVADWHSVTAQVNSGTVTAEPETALPGTTVTLTFIPEGSYTRLDAPAVLCGEESVDTVQTGTYTYTFLMPAGDVTVSAMFREPQAYSFYFVNWDDRILQWMSCFEGDTPAYTGNTPEKEPTVESVFTFAGWDREIVPATEDAVYRAAFTSAVRSYPVSFLDWNGDVLFETKTPYGETPAYTGETPQRPMDDERIYVFEDWTPEIVPVDGNAVYMAVYTATHWLGEGENSIPLRNYQVSTYVFIPEVTNYFRLQCPDGPARCSLSVYDGNERVAYGVRYSSDESIDFARELEGGKAYTVQALSWSGNGELSLRITPTAMHQIHLVNEEPYGYIEIHSGYTAYEGQYISIYPFMEMDYYDIYDIVDVIATNADGEVIDTGWNLYMPAFDIWLRPVFQRMQPITIVMDDMIDIMLVETEDHAFSWDNARAAEGRTIRMYAYCMLEDEEIDAVTVTAQDGSSIPCTYEEDTEMGMPCYRFVMPDGPVTVRMKRTGTAPDFEYPDIILPSALTAIEESAFEGDESISVVEIPAGCKSIGKWAFKDCANLWMIRIPAGCAVGEDAFTGCVEVYVYGADGSPAWTYCQSHDNCMFVEE